MHAPPEIDLYPVRPRWQPGESLAGYCWRIYAMNGLAPVGPSTMKGLWTQRDPWRVDLTMAGRLIGAEVAHAIGGSEDRLLKDVLSGGRFGYRATRHRFCPLCVEDDQRHKLIWDLPLVTACPDHGCRLMDRCDQCRRPLAWTRLDADFTCSCRRVLSKATQAAGRAQLRFAGAVACAIDAHAATRSSAPDQGSCSPRLEYAVRDVYELLRWADHWTPYRQKREAPPSSVLRLVGGEPKRMVHVMWRLLCRKRRRTPDILIDVEGDDATSTWFLMKNWISRSSNPLLREAGAAGSRLEGRYHAAINSLPSAAFDPSLSPDYRSLADTALTRWWRALADCLQPVEGEPLVGSPALASDRMRLLNRLCEVALREVPVTALSMVAARWRMSPMLRSVASVSELASRLAELHTAEHEFLFALLEHDLDRWHRATGGAAGATTNCSDG